MKRIPSVIRDHVSLTLKAAQQRRKAIMEAKTSDLGSSLQKYSKMLEDLKEEADDLKKEMKNLKRVFVKASKTSVKQQLEESIATFRKAREHLAKANSFLVEADANFRGHPSATAKSLIKAAEKMAEEASELNKEKEAMLSALTKTHVPIQLTTDDEKFFRPLVKFVVDDIKKTRLSKGGEKANLLMKESKYIPGIVPGNAGQIRWARYIPLTDIPTIHGETKSTHIVVCITFMAYTEKKGRIVPMMITDKRGVEKPAVSQISIGMLSKYNDPIALSSHLFKVSSLNEAKDILAYLAQKESLSLFGPELEGTVESRVEKVKEKLRVLNDPEIKIIRDKEKRNFITIKVPKTKVDTNLGTTGGFPKTEQPTEWDKKLYMDVQAYAGLPANSRYNYGRLRIEKVYAKDGFVYFLFRVLRIEQKQLIKDEIVNKKLDSMGVDSEFDEDSGRAGFSMDGLHKLADSWLKMGR